ncbi:ABC transporter permease subunit [Chungangia koreensis]|uniref:ABC transporter permease subunit n=1 Tax=Chungangia koreensis TaxID=752657 RepID=A0ABV8X0H8_9LACT
MRGVIETITRFFFVVFGLIVITAVASVFLEGFKLDFGQFVDNFALIVKSLFFPENLTVTTGERLLITGEVQGTEYSIFPSFWNYYNYSLIIFITALLISVLIGILLTYITVLLPERIRNVITKMASLFESLPDLFIIMVIQFVVIFYYKQTNILLFPVAGTGTNRAYVLPIIALALIPTFMIFKVILYLTNDEMEKQYVTLAKSKGFNRTIIFFRHILRNMIPSIFTHSKSVVLYLLSSLVIFELIFNIYGIITYIKNYPEPNVIAFSLIMFYLPIFVLYAIITAIIEKTTGQRLEW